MIHRVHTAVDKNSIREAVAVVANLIDWNSAFVRQCPKLGIISYQKNGIQNSFFLFIFLDCAWGVGMSAAAKALPLSPRTDCVRGSKRTR